jgi:hypothetical protein
VAWSSTACLGMLDSYISSLLWFNSCTHCLGAGKGIIVEPLYSTYCKALLRLQSSFWFWPIAYPCVLVKKLVFLTSKLILSKVSPYEIYNGSAKSTFKTIFLAVNV